MVNNEEIENDAEDVQREPEYLRKLFIGGLDFRTTEESLKGFYEKWGEIVDVVVMKDSKTKRSRGFGFITYSASSMLDEAQLNRPHVIDGRTVEPKRAIPRNEIHSPETNATVKKLFIAGIKDEVTEEEMKEYFGQYGNVINVVIVTEKETGKKRGFGFVEYDDYDPVDKACLIHSHSLSGKRVDVKKAIGKSEMSRAKPRQEGAGWSSGRDPWSGNYGGDSWGDDQWGGGNDGWGGSNRGWGQGGGYEDSYGGGGPIRSGGSGGGRSAPYRGGGAGGSGGGGPGQRRGGGRFGRY